MSTGKHALVFGASGICGWGVVNAILNGYPSKETFSRVSGLTHRPLSQEAAGWPDDPRLHTVSGIDLLEGSQEDLEKALSEQIPDIATVTQFFFFARAELTRRTAYQFCRERNEESEINKSMIDRSVRAIEKLSPNLEHAYGVHLNPFPYSKTLPLKESHPRIPEPDRSELFYYHQHDTLKSLSEGKTWTWTEIRPDVIIGYVPHNNTYCIAQSLGIYLALYAYVEGKGAKIAFPGTEKSYRNLSNDSSQGIVARFAIHAALTGQKTKGRTFNVADNRLPTSWADRWPVICKWFGLKGTGPEEGSPQPGPYMEKYREQWDEMAAKHQLRDTYIGNPSSSPTFLHFCTTIMDFDRQLDLLEQRSTGFTEETDTKGAWWPAFEKFRAGKIIP
ncbi:Short chain dehydrogenase [Lachnellula occidentalis]|uniref:Short chain dehydrogenase n=1 Tax=Lachnellula occidentalis TaxID=215460 RepID=A0A8H8RUG4_9HELO|nr:Short chain dehydrogenase [Lachnellula occidentalis]